MKNNRNIRKNTPGHRPSIQDLEPMPFVRIAPTWEQHRANPQPVERWADRGDTEPVETKFPGPEELRGRKYCDLYRITNADVEEAADKVASIPRPGMLLLLDEFPSPDGPNIRALSAAYQKTNPDHCIAKALKHLVAYMDHVESCTKDPEPVILNLPLLSRDGILGLPFPTSSGGAAFARPKWWDHVVDDGCPIHVEGWEDASERQQRHFAEALKDLPWTTKVTGVPMSMTQCGRKVPVIDTWDKYLRLTIETFDWDDLKASKGWQAIPAARADMREFLTFHELSHHFRAMCVRLDLSSHYHWSAKLHHRLHKMFTDMWRDEETRKLIGIHAKEFKRNR